MVIYVAWTLTILTAIVGWGVATAWALGALGRIDLLRPTEVLALGVASCIALAGTAVALNRFDRFVGLFLVAGVAIATFAAVVSWLGRRNFGVTVRTLLVVGLLVLSVVVLAFSWTAHVYWNPCDDGPAYLYLAERLLAEGDLLDPLSFRRATSLGAMSALQALFLVRLPDTFLQLADALLGSLLILVGLWRTRTGTWSLFGVAAAVLVILHPGEALGAINSTPILIPVGLALAVFSTAVRLRTEPTSVRASIALSVLVGLLVGSAAALRPQFGFAISLFVIVALAWPPIGIGSIYRFAGCATGASIVLSGWAVASWRAVGTPMFPLFNGNVDEEWISRGPQTSGDPSLIGLLHRVGGTRDLWACAAALVLALIVLWRARRRGRIGGTRSVWLVRLLIAAAVVAISWMTLQMWFWWGYDNPVEYARFWTPIVLASILLPLVVLNWTADQRAWSTRAAGLAALCLVAFALRAGWDDVRASFDDAVRGTGSGYVEALLSTDRYVGQREHYDEVVGLVPDGSKVLTAVDAPSLLVGKGFGVHTLDIVGATAPTPRLPYFEGSDAKLSWLRGQGYDYLVVVDPEVSSCLYNRARHQTYYDADDGSYIAWERYYFDWFRFLRAMSRSGAPARKVGPLIVFRLDPVRVD